MTEFRRWLTAAVVLSLSIGFAQAQAPYLISTYAGGLTAPTAVLAVQGSSGYAFEDPAGVVTDPFGNTYISTTYNCVFRLDANGYLSRVAGTCRPGFSGDAGNALNAQLNDPTGLALDVLGNLYVVDQGNQRIRKVTPAGIISTVAGNGTAGYLGDNGAATSAELNNPQGVVLDAAFNLYIADSGNFRIRKVTPGGTITTYAGTGASGNSGDGGLAVAATFTSPTAVALDSKGDLYICDTGVSEVRMVNPSGTISHIAGTGSAGYSGDPLPAVSSALSFPQGLALDAAGNLYIADRGNYRVRVVGVTGIMNTYAGDGSFGDSGDGGPATSAELLSPVSVATDYAGDLYIADQIGVVRKVNTSGTISTVSGNAPSSLPFSGDGGPAALAQIATPWGIALGSGNNACTPTGTVCMYIADWRNNRVRVINTSTGVISTFAGNGLYEDNGDNGPAISASVTPATLAVDSSGNVYLADAGVVRKINTAGTISTIAGDGVFGYAGDNGSAIDAELQSYLPGLAFDSKNNLIYISDWYNQRVRKVTVATGIISAFAGTGTAGYSGDGAAATSAKLQYPAGLALDSAGNLYIADSSNCRVRMVNTSGIISTVAGNGTCGSTVNGQPATSAEISTPWAVAVDGSSNLYIATGEGNATSTGNGILEVSAATHDISTIAGTGVAGYSGDPGLATSAQLNNPLGLALDSHGNIYVSDFANSAVRVLQPETEPLLTVTSTHTGTFPAGKTGTFSITVNDAALAAASSGTVTVSATLPASFTPVAMSGTGWTCSTGSVPFSCSTTGGLAGAGAITLTVNVPSSPPQVTNQVTVSGGGALPAGSQDLAFVGSATAVLELSLTHAGDFVAGAQGTFTITVGNQLSATATSGQVTVTDNLPTSLTLASSLQGNPSVWTCTGASCTTTAALAGGANFAPIMGTVNVSSSASPSLINSATASGGGSTVSPSANDTITVLSLAGCEITGNNSVTVADVQAIINQGLGTSQAANDVNRDGVVNVVDIQIVINAALNYGCAP